MQTRSWIGENAETLADNMLALAQWSKKSPLRERYAAASAVSGLIKLPPVFQAEPGSKHGDGRRNLIAMLRVLAEYEEGIGDRPPLTLAELPERYNLHGGTPALGVRDLRRVHNWLQQVAFGVRAAVMASEEERPTAGWEKFDVPERVLRRLFLAPGTRRAFVTFAPDSRYEFKPLRHAPDEAIRRWLQQEWRQRRAWVTGETTDVYGAQPTAREWEAYGSRGQNRNLSAAVTHQVEAMRIAAQQADLAGRWEQADELDEALVALAQNLQGWGAL